MAKYGCIILKGESIIKDEDSGSKSLFPIEVEKDHQVKLYRTDIQEQVEARSKACKDFGKDHPLPKVSRHEGEETPVEDAIDYCIGNHILVTLVPVTFNNL